MNRFATVIAAAGLAAVSGSASAWWGPWNEGYQGYDSGFADNVPYYAYAPYGYAPYPDAPYNRPGTIPGDIGGIAKAQHDAFDAQQKAASEHFKQMEAHRKAVMQRMEEQRKAMQQSYEEMMKSREAMWENRYATPVPAPAVAR
jgi:hypothetical protein